MPIEVTELPIVTDVKPLQPEKAELPIEATELGIVTDVKPLQFWKQHGEIETVPSFMEINVPEGIMPLYVYATLPA